MGTSRRDHRRTRRARRGGFASFAAFALLFALALGQGGSIVAFASGTATTISNNGSAPVADGGGSGSATKGGGSGGGSAARTSSDDGASPTTSTQGAGGAGTSDSDGGQAEAAAATLDGGDISLDYVAAGPFTYDHDTGLGTRPQFGYDNRQISKSNGVVESLESGDFACGDYVTFFTQVKVDAGADSGGTIELDYTFGAETTGQPGLGFDDIISVAVNTPDDGNKNLDGDEVATLIAEGFDSSGYDQVTGTVEIEGLDAGDVVIVRLIVELTCEPGETPTGNILNAIEAGRVTSPEEDTINVGQQTVPMKTTGFVAEPAIDIEKTCPAASPFGDDITYDITITNSGNEDLENIVVTDTVDGHAPDDISDLFADTLVAGDSDSAQYVYSPVASDPDPLPNTVEVTADGVHSSTQVTDSDTCDTDITHEPAIDVTKSCPAQAGEGDTVTYSITVSNTGNEALEDVTVMDSVLGDLSDSFGDTLAVGASETHEFDYTVPEGGDDPLVNVVTVSGAGVDSGTTVTSTATCSTDILHPGIAIVKTVSDDTVAVGDTVTYTFVVTNTGDTTLYDITVDDDVLGHIGDIAVLEPGESTTLTADFVVGDVPVTNVAIARGHDILGRVVESSDTALVTPILPASTTSPPPPTPFTGSDAGRLGLISLLVFGIGLTVVAATSRWRSRDTA
jgi:hypothetical protein